MHLGDSIFIFILALVLFGPKKLPEMAKQIGKLMAEFRRASNDFRLQIDEELRTMERQEQLAAQQKKQEAERAALPGPSVLAPAAPGELLAGDSAAPTLGLGPAPGEPAPLQILPPSIGEQVSAGTPYAVSADPSPADQDHPLLQVDTIPVDPEADPAQPTGLAAAEANAARLGETPETLESQQASLHHG